MKFLKVMKLRKGKPINFEKIEPRINNLSKKFDILLLYLFGSYSSEQAYKLSDIDIAFLSKRKLDLNEILALFGELQDIFQAEAVDLVDLEKVPLTLIHRIIKEGRCLYMSDIRTKIEFELKNESLYYDTEPLRKEYFKEIERRIKNGTLFI